MDRINGTNVDPNANGPGKRGFTEAAPGSGLPTVLTPEWCNLVQEEIVGAVEGMGLSLNPNDTTQLYQAIQALKSQVAVHNHIGGYRFTRYDSADPNKDIVIYAGAASDSSNTTQIKITTSIVKRLDEAWAPGSQAGGLSPNWTIAPDTWYGVFVLGDDNGNTDAGFDRADDAGGLMANTSYTYYRRIGWIRTDASSNIMDFYRLGDFFYWKDPVNIYAGAAPTTAALVTTKTAPMCVGIFNASFASDTADDVTHYMLMSSTYRVDSVPDSTNFCLHGRTSGGGGFEYETSGQFEIAVPGTEQIRLRATHASNTTVINALGWIDDRGRT